MKDRSLVSKIVVRRNLVQALNGIEDFSHLFVIFDMNQVKEKALTVHPRSRTVLPLVGVFAARTARRPNPTGLTLVELLERKDNGLVVGGWDAFDKTPVLDLKPADSWDVPKISRFRNGSSSWKKRNEMSTKD